MRMWKTGTLLKGYLNRRLLRLLNCQCLGTRSVGQGIGGPVVWEERLLHLHRRGPLPQTGAVLK